MYIDGSVVHYLLVREFGDAVCDAAARYATVDYPILYEEGADMSQHVVLVPDHERPDENAGLMKSICICMCDESADATRAAGFPVIQVKNHVSFPRLYNFMQALFVRFERLDARFRAFVDAHAGAQALLDACAETTGYPFMLVDEHYREICHSSTEGAYSQHDRPAASGDSMLNEDAIDLFMASRRYQHMRLTRNVFTTPGSSDLLMKNLFSGGELRGIVLSRHDGDVLSARYVSFFLGYLGRFVSSLYEKTNSFGMFATEANRIRAVLSRRLSDGSASDSDVEALLLQDGHDSDSEYVILRIERSFTHEGQEGLLHLSRRFELAWPHVYCFTVEGTMYMLADTSSRMASGKHDFMKDILIVARDNLCKVGASRSFRNMSQLDAAQVQASIALSQGNGQDPMRWFYRFDDYALSWLIEHGRRDIPAEYVIHAAVSTLKRYDEAHGTDLLHTLALFIRLRYNATHTANELYIARSTLLNRLDRVVELTGLDFDDTDDLVYLCVSIAITHAA